VKNTFSRNDLIGVPDRYSRHGDGDDLFHELPLVVFVAAAASVLMIQALYMTLAPLPAT
jgi:hypothetical protein